MTVVVHDECGTQGRANDGVPILTERRDWIHRVESANTAFAPAASTAGSSGPSIMTPTGRGSGARGEGAGKARLRRSACPLQPFAGRHRPQPHV